MQIRAEKEEDRTVTQRVNESAFETPAEATLVVALREQARPVISLVAEDGGAILGHIIFLPFGLPAHPELKIMGLAPMAVSPEHQRQGIGSTLVRAGLEECKKLGFGAVVVLGHPKSLSQNCHFEPEARNLVARIWLAPEISHCATLRSK